MSDKPASATSASVAGRSAHTSRSRGRRRRRELRLGWPLTVVLVAAIVGAVVWVVAGERASSGPDPAPVVAPLTGTAAITRADFVESEVLDGTLRYDAPTVVLNHLPGTITELAEEGIIIKRGTVLYQVDGRPAFVMYGDIPAYRTLERGMDDGPDVKQVEQNLVELGFDPEGKIEVDNAYTGHTANAIERLQIVLGTAESGNNGEDDKSGAARGNGTVPLGSIVFLPEGRRLGQYLVEIGALVSPGTPIADITAPTQVVVVDLEADRQDLLAEGDAVEIELPSEERVAARVSRVGNVATADVLPDGTRTNPTIEVTIAFDDPIASGLDEAPVEVLIDKQASRDVLAAPLTALVALKGGGYAVEVIDGATTRLVAVEPGLFANGLVEITRGELDVGTEVVVPR